MKYTIQRDTFRNYRYKNIYIYMLPLCFLLHIIAYFYLRRDYLRKNTKINNLLICVIIGFECNNISEFNETNETQSLHNIGTMQSWLGQHLGAISWAV